MVNVLVTGAAGFIGSHLTRDLVSSGGYKVVALDDLSGGYLENIPKEVTFFKASINDYEFLEELFKKYDFKYVYHLAAYAAEGLSHFIRRFNYTNNLIGSVNLINEAIKHDVKCFVFTSSIAVYGTGQVPMREDMVPEPEDPYGISKYAVELDLKNAHEMFGLNYVIFRPHNVYGEYQNIGDKYRNVVGIFMNQILQNKPMTIFGDGKQERAFTYVGDIVKNIAACVKKSNALNQIFNVGADRPYTVNKLAAEVAKAMDAPGHPIKHFESRNEVQFAFSDHSFAKAIFSNDSQTSLQDGLLKMSEWVKGVGSRNTPEFKDIEVTKNIPNSWLK